MKARPKQNNCKERQQMKARVIAEKSYAVFVAVALLALIGGTVPPDQHARMRLSHRM